MKNSIMKKLFSKLVLVFIVAPSFAQQWGEYTLYSTMNGTTTYLCDTTGATYHTWTHGSSDKTAYSSYLMPGGELVRTVVNSGNSFNGGGVSGRIQKVDYAGNITWNYTHSSTNYCLHHDICPLPNGNVLMISYEKKTAAEAVAAGSSFNGTIWSEKVIEVQPTGATTGTIVWEWHLWDHLVQNYDNTKANYQSTIVDHPELMNLNYDIQQDWIHMNGIDYNPILDQIALSSHNMNEWYIIDHSTTTAEAATHTGGNSGKGGDFLFRWGNPDAYDASGATILDVTHDAHWIPEGSPNEGWLVGFNNKGVSNSQSSVDMIEMDRTGYNYDHVIGQAYQPSTYDFRHECNGYASNMSNSNQLPNGNMLICIATSGLIYETDPNETTIWSKTVSGMVPQAHRYEACYVNNAAPAIPVISPSGSDIISTTATTYQWYYNGDLIPGATSQSYTPSQTGIYVVRITDSNGCVYRYSSGFYYDAGSVGMAENETSLSIQVYPNPSTGIFNLENEILNYSEYTTTVSNSLGEVIYQNENESSFNLGDFPNGIYFVNVITRSGDVFTNQLILQK